MTKGQIDSLLEQGIEAARLKENVRARDTFVHVIEIDEHNEQAWLWLSTVVDTHADRMVCLENVLLINPDNTYAAMRLRNLRQRGQEAISSILPRLGGSQVPAGGKRDSSPESTSPSPTARTCPRCGLRNPGWAYLCDRCGANLRRVDLRDSLREASRPRGRSVLTLLEAWGGAVTFNRVWTFQPEVGLASWGRTAAALIMAVLFAAIWRPITSLVLWLLVSDGAWKTRIAVNALRSGAETLVPALLLALVSAPIALLTWLAARAVGGKAGFKTHLHLTAVAFTAWMVLVTLLVPLTILVPYLAGGDTAFDLAFGIATSIIGVIVGAAGLVWLMQAICTAQALSVTRTIVTAMLTAVLGALLFLALNLLTDGGLADTLSRLVTTPFLPLPNLEM